MGVPLCRLFLAAASSPPWFDCFTGILFVGFVITDSLYDSLAQLGKGQFWPVIIPVGGINLAGIY